jgi:hypothetical protein
MLVTADIAEHLTSELAYSDEGDLSRWRYEDALVLAKDMSDHSGPVVSKCACLANKGEVGGVRDAVGVVAAGHVGAVHCLQYGGLP